MTSIQAPTTPRHVQFEQTFDPKIGFNAHTYPHWTKLKAR